MSVPDCCENCDYSPVSFGSRNRCPIYDKGIRDKKQIPLGKDCEFYYNLRDAADAILEKFSMIKVDNV